jgi:SAM-dependent methyltransferase
MSGVENSSYTGTNLLFEIENNLPNYNLSIVKMISECFPAEGRRSENYSILDFGAGTGHLAQLLQNETNATIDCLEIDAALGDIILSKDMNLFRDITELKHQYDLIYTSNVLEHISNDFQIISQLYAKIKPGGAICIYVPASPSIYSQLDREVGHFRRYKKAELISKVEGAKFTVSNVWYTDSLGYLASIMIKICGFRSFGNIGGAKSLRLYDNYIFPVSKILDSIGMRRIIGKNLFLVASKIEHLQNVEV